MEGIRWKKTHNEKGVESKRKKKEKEEYLQDHRKLHPWEKVHEQMQTLVLKLREGKNRNSSDKKGMISIAPIKSVRKKMNGSFSLSLFFFNREKGIKMEKKKD